MFFMERHDLCKLVWDEFRSEQAVNAHDRAFSFLAIVGTPGSGKTRFVAEALKQPHPSVAEHFAHYLHLHTTYNNGNGMTQLDVQDPARCFALRLLHHYFTEGAVRLREFLATLYKATLGLGDSGFSLDTALEIIREDYIRTNKLEANTVVNIAIGVDECSGSPAHASRGSSALQQIVQVLGSTRLDPPKGVRLFVLFAGASQLSIVSAGLGSEFRVQCLRLAPLKTPSALTIISDVLKSEAVFTDACLKS